MRARCQAMLEVKDESSEAPPSPEERTVWDMLESVWLYTNVYGDTHVWTCRNNGENQVILPERFSPKRSRRDGGCGDWVIYFFSSWLPETGWPWTPDLSVSTFQVLGLQAYAWFGSQDIVRLLWAEKREEETSHRWENPTGWDLHSCLIATITNCCKFSGLDRVLLSCNSEGHESNLGHNWPSQVVSRLCSLRELSVHFGVWPPPTMFKAYSDGERPACSPNFSSSFLSILLTYPEKGLCFQTLATRLGSLG